MSIINVGPQMRGLACLNMSEPTVPTFAVRETQSLGQQMLNRLVGINGLMVDIIVLIMRLEMLKCIHINIQNIVTKCFPRKLEADGGPLKCCPRTYISRILFGLEFFPFFPYRRSMMFHSRLLFSTHREIFSKSYLIKPKSDCIYHAPIELEPNGHQFGSKSICAW